MSDERKYAILFAATILCARKLAMLESNGPTPAKVYAVETAIDQAKFILDRIDNRWPNTSDGKVARASTHSSDAPPPR